MEKSEEKLTQAVHLLRSASPDLEQGKRALHDALQLRQGQPGAEVAVAERLLSEGLPTNAATVLSEATEQPELANDPLVWGLLSKAQRKRGDLKAASELLRKARTLAREILKGVNKAVPKDEHQRLAAVQRFVSAGRFFAELADDTPSAIIALQEAVHLGPGDPLLTDALDVEALRACGYTLAEYGTTKREWDTAQQLTLQAIKSAKNEDGTLYDAYGWALYKKNDVSGALRVLRRAVSLSPNLPQARFHLATVFAKRGERAAALLEFDRALTLRADYPEARSAREVLGPLPSPSPSPSPAAPPVASK